MTTKVAEIGGQLIEIDNGAIQVSLPDYEDGLTTALVMIDYAHHEIHSGNHYKAGYQNTSLAAGGTIQLLFVTPDSAVQPHWTLTAQATGAATIQVFEGGTISGGTAVIPTNRNRNSTNTSTVGVFHTPTVTSTGSKISEQWIGGTGFKESISGSFRGDSEFVLLRNANYLVRGVSNADDAIKLAIGGDWYEHTEE